MVPSHIVAKTVVFNDKHEVLLLRRSKTAPRRPLQWDFPGGGVDEGEDFAAAAARELSEEVQIDITPSALRLVWANTALKEGISVTWLMFIARVETTKVVLSFEHDKYCWMSIDDAISELEYPLQITVLKHIRDNKLASLVV